MLRYDIFFSCMVHQDLIIGAFAGAAIFVIWASEYSFIKQFVFFVVSFATGIITNGVVIDIVTYLTLGGVTISPMIGALVSAALSVRMVMIISNDPMSFFTNIINIIRGGQ